MRRLFRWLRAHWIAVRDIGARAGRLTLRLPASVTEALLTRTGAVFHAGINDVLLTGLVLAVLNWCRRRRRGTETAVLIDIEGHGREEIFADVDLSRTLGWFTSLFPMRLDAGALELAEALRGGPALGRAVKSIKEQMHAVTDRRNWIRVAALPQWQDGVAAGGLSHA